MYRIVQILLLGLLSSNMLLAQAIIPRDEERQFVHFLMQLELITTSQQAEQIGELLATAEENNASARFLALAEKYLYDPNSPYRNDEQYLLFLQYASEHRLKDYLANSRYQKHYAMVQKNRVGNVATDFAYSTQMGTKGNLYGLHSRYILLFFHDPNCEECQFVQQHLEKNHISFTRKGVQIVAIYIDENVAEWKRAIYPVSWLSVYAPEIDTQNLYDIKALPTLYLLDAQKKVVQKDVRLEQFMEYIL